MTAPSPSTNLRQRLRDGGTVVGSWINSGSPMVAELMAGCGFDFLCVDVEHSAVDLPQVQQLFQAIRSGHPRCAALVRLHGVDYAFAKRYLDAGAAGLIAPLVRTRDDALLLVQAAKYPPQGLRGVGFCRANDYGLHVTEECARANEEILVVVQIEHIDAVRNIDAIVSVPGIDAAFIGPYDLTASMGVTGQFEHPDYLAARAEILAACGRHRIAPGIHAVAPDISQAQARLKEGYRLLAYSLDITMLTAACTAGVAALCRSDPESGRLPPRS
jgi:2-dehydro-3-deoxyglucarate aldolase